MDFLGKPISYWIELQSNAEALLLDRLILQNAYLRSRVSYYEARLDEMLQWKEHLDKEQNLMEGK